KNAEQGDRRQTAILRRTPTPITRCVLLPYPLLPHPAPGFPMARLKKHGFHYAWVVLAAACVLNVVARADQSSFGVFIDPLVEQFGWSRGEISFAYSLAF